MLDASSLFMLFLAHCPYKSHKSLVRKYAFQATKSACLLGYEHVLRFIYKHGYRNPEAYKWLIVANRKALIKMYQDKVKLEQKYFDWAAGYLGVTFDHINPDTKEYAAGLFREDRSVEDNFILFRYADYYGRIDILEYLGSNVWYRTVYLNNLGNRIACMQFLRPRNLRDVDPWLVHVDSTTTPDILTEAIEKDGWNPDLKWLKSSLERHNNKVCVAWLKEKVLCLMEGLFAELKNKRDAIREARAAEYLHIQKIYKAFGNVWIYSAVVDGRRQKMAGVFLTKEDAEKEFIAWKNWKLFEILDPLYECVSAESIGIDQIEKHMSK